MYNNNYMITLNNFEIQSFFDTSKLMTAQNTWQKWARNA